MQKVNLGEKLAQFSDQWKPKIVGELNDQLVKLVKFRGPFVWHHHDHEDELFLVVKGRFRMESGRRRASSWSCPVASNTGPSPSRRRTSCCSSRHRR
jgi:mannose-6-phosphate isomerase-like protein (cupin superfamily)